MKFKCPACGLDREVSDRVIGRKFRCSGCQAKIKHHPDGRFETVDPFTESEEREVTPPQPASSQEPNAAPATPPAPATDGGSVALDKMSGQVVGHYLLIGLIGTGGYSHVYLAEHQTLKRKMAVKLLSPALTPTPEHTDRLAREAVTLAKVEHPNIVRVYDFGNEKGIPYIAMQYVDGQSLDEQIKNAGKLPVDQLFKIASEILIGLGTIHAAGLLHRDIKPSNVLVSKEGQVMLADFGLARDIPPDAEPKSTVFSGTATYAAPELAVGRPPDIRTDLYAVGATLYKAATGRVPFSGATTKEILNKQLYDPLVPPTVYNPELPAPLEKLISLLLDKDPEKRPTSAEYAAKHLKVLAPAKPKPRAHRTARKVIIQKKSSGPMVAILVVLALLLAGGGVAFFVLNPGANKDPQGPEAPLVKTPEPESPEVTPASTPKPLPRRNPTPPPPKDTTPDNSPQKAIPSVLKLKQGTFVAGIVKDTGGAYHVTTGTSEFMFPKGDVLAWYKTAAEMSADATESFKKATSLYERARVRPTNPNSKALLEESRHQFEKARDGYEVTRRYFQGPDDKWLDRRFAACFEGLRLVRDLLGSIAKRRTGTPPPKPGPAPKPPPKPKRKDPGVPGRKMDPNIVLGLTWLARHHSSDGFWKVKDHASLCRTAPRCTPVRGHEEFDVGVTSLAMLAIMGSGIGIHDNDVYDNQNIGAHLRGGTIALIGNQGVNGELVSLRRQKYMYSHALATYALAEVCISAKMNTSANAILVKRATDALKKATEFLIAAQNPGKGWRYSSRSRDNDSSVTALALLALDAAKRAGVAVPQSAMQGGLNWFAEASEDSGRIGYTHKGTGKVFVPGMNENYDHHETLSVAGWLCKAIISRNRKAGREFVFSILQKDRPDGDGNARDAYYWYYSIRYVKSAGSASEWSSWRSEMSRILIRAQNQLGAQCKRGSWEPNTRWAGEGGRIYTTALNLITLEYAKLSTPFKYRRGSGATPGPAPASAFKVNWIIHLKSGGKLRVSSYEETGDKYSLTVKAGKTQIAKSQVARIEKVAAASKLPSAGLVGHWAFDEGQGTRVGDSSPAGNHGALQNGTRWVPGVKGTALQFDGSDDYAVLPVKSMPGTKTPQTVSWWFKTLTVPGTVQNMISLSNDGAGASVQPGFRLSRLAVLNFTGESIVSAKVANSGKWHHAAYTFDGSMHSLYLNGKLASTARTPRTAAKPSSLNFGRSSGGDSYYHGLLDEIRIYTRSLTAAEIAQLSRVGH